MTARPVNTGVDMVAQTLCAAECSNPLERRHSWTEHRDVAVKVCAVVGVTDIGHRIEVAFKQGFDSRNQQVADFRTEIEGLKAENTRLTQLLGEHAGARKTLADKHKQLQATHDAERQARNEATLVAEAARRELLTETVQRVAAEDRARVCSRELGDAYKQLAVARDREAVHNTSRLQLAEWLEHTTDFPSTGEEGTGGIHA